MLRCAELNLSRDDLDEMTIGMIYDMCIEKGNDNEKYPIKAEKGTLASFLRGEITYGNED